MFLIDCGFMDLYLFHYLPAGYVKNKYLLCLVHLDHYTLISDLLRGFSLISSDKD